MSQAIGPEVDNLANEIEALAYKEFLDAKTYPRGFSVIPDGVDILWDTPDNDLGYVRPYTYELQCTGIFNTARYCVIEASTKAGKTLACMLWIYEQAVLNGGINRNFWWVGPVSDQSDIAFRRLKEYIPKDMYDSNESRKYIRLWNGSTIWFKSGDKPDSLYGEDVYAAVVDEASRVKLESWQALRSTLTFTRGPVRIIGNVKGRANWMYKLGRIALAGDDPEFAYAKITAMDAADAGVLEWKEVWDAKKVYDDMSFRELYLAEPADDGGNPFGIEHIQNCIAEHISSNDPVAFGWDVAKGNNWVVGIGLDKEGNVCRFHRWRDSWDGTIAKVLSYTGKVPSLVDSTGSGDQLLERLRDEGGRNFTGLVFSQRSKQELMIGLAVAIQAAEIAYPDGPIVYELELFEYEISAQGNIKYAAPQGYHDDCVDALALAVKKWRSLQTVYMGAAPISIEQTSPWVI
jgi:hypothetical protein